MKLTPLDIRKQDFSRKFRGYDPEEVLAFLNMVASQWEGLLDERQRSENKLAEFRAKLEHYEKVEVALEEALRITRQSSEKTIQNAENKARNLIERAEDDARRTEEQARKTVQEIRRQASRLNDYRLELMARLRALLTSETELLARYEEHAKVVLDRLYAASESGADPQELPETPPARTAARTLKDPAPPVRREREADPEMDADADAGADTDPDASGDVAPDFSPVAPLPKARKPKRQEEVADKPDSSSDIQHIRRILKDLD